MKQTIIQFLYIILILSSITVCFFTAFVQTSKGNGLSPITGQGLALFQKTKVRGSEKKVQNIVASATVLIFFALLALLYTANHVN